MGEQTSQQRRVAKDFLALACILKLQNHVNIYQKAVFGRAADDDMVGENVFTLILPS